MNRAFIVSLAAVLVVPPCSGDRAAKPPAQSPASGAAGGGAAPAAAARLTDACSLMPAGLAQKLVPGAAAPERERYPLRCTLGNGKSALQIALDNGPPEPVNGAEFIPGLAAGGYLERLDPHSRGDPYLTVILGQDPNGTNWNLHVEVAGHDGKDHKDDAIAVAREVLAQLR